MRIDSAFLEDRLGAWSTSGPFEEGDDGWVELDRRNVVFQSLEIGEDPVFTSGSNETLRFESRPMWANLTEMGEGFVLVLEDGDTTGQEVFVAKELLYSHGIHRPIVTHEDGSVLEVRESEDGSGFWVDYHHFTAARYDPQDLLILKRQGLLTTTFNGDKEFDPDTEDLFVQASNSLSSYELMFEVEWFEANMPHLGLVGYEWYEDEHNGDEFYVVELSSADTPTELHFMEYGPTDDWVFTNGNPDNLYLFPFNETARENLGPINIKVDQDAHGVDLKLDVHGGNDFELLIAEEWINSVIDEHPVFERKATPWVPAEEESLLGGGYILPGVVSSTYRIWDSISGPLVPPEYEVVDAGVLRPVDGCAIRHLAVVENGSLIHDGPACFTNEEVLDLMEGADQVHWRYNPIWGPDHISYSSAARMCAMVVEGTGSGEVNWVGSPCLEYKSTSGSPPSFLSDLCSTMTWGNWSDAAFCGDGLTRYQTAGMDLGVEDAKAEVMAEVLFQNDAMMEGMNEIFANESIQGEWDWLEDVRGFLHALRLDEPCLNGGGLLTVDHSIPDQACGRTLNEFSEGNETIEVDPGLVQAGWDLLGDGKPCEASLEALVVLGREPAGYCGSQLPLMREPVGQILESVDWNQTCSDRGFLMVGFEGSSSSTVCANAAPDPDQTLDHVLETTGIESQSICYVDQSATGYYYPGDPVYLAFSSCNGTVAENDLRLHHTTLDSGSKVSTGDSDFGASYLESTEGPAFHYHDMDADGAPGPGDLFYLCISDMDLCGDVVGEGWLRLTSNDSHDAGSVVSTGDEIGLNVSSVELNADLGEHFRFVDLDDSGVFDDSDVLYWTTTGSTTNPSEGHVRLGALSGTGGFGEVLESGMVDVEQDTWFQVKSWEACASEVSFLLDPAAGVPDWLCGDSTAGLEFSLDFTLESVLHWVEQNSICGVEESPLVIADRAHSTPSVVCVVALSSEDDEWQDAWADLVEISPCDEATWLSSELAGGDNSGDDGKLDTYKLCGEVFEDPNRSLETVYGIVADCTNGEVPSIGLSSEAMYSVCGGDVDPPIGVDNPCGIEDVAVPSGFEDDDFDGKEVCGQPIPDVGELIAALIEYAPDECALTGELLEERSDSEDKTVCGIGPGDQYPDLDQVWEMIEDANPCPDDTEFVMGFNEDDPFAMCGGKLGDAMDEVEDNGPCDPEELIGETDICGIPFEVDPVECDDSGSEGVSLCATYVLNEVDEVSTYMGMPGAFTDGVGVDAFGWFVGAPLAKVDMDPEECPEGVCINFFGVAGTYMVGVTDKATILDTADMAVHIGETSLAIDSVNSNPSVGQEVLFAAVSGVVAVTGMVGDDSPVTLAADLLFADAFSDESTVSANVGDFEVALAFESRGTSGSVLQEVGVDSLPNLWAIGLLERPTEIDGSNWEIQELQGSMGVLADAPVEGRIIDLDWVSPVRSNLGLMLGLGDLDHIEIGVEMMPSMLTGASVLYSVGSVETYLEVYWPGEEALAVINLQVGDFPLDVSEPPMSFVVQVFLDLLEEDEAGWSRAHVAVRSEETDFQELAELPGRMDLSAFVSNTTVDLEGLSHNVNFQFEIELGDPEVLFPGLVLLLENPSAGPSFLNPVVRKINIDDGEGLAVDLQELTSADVDTTREENGIDLRMNLNGMADIRFPLEDQVDMSVHVDASCVRLMGDFELFAAKEEDSGEDPSEDEWWKGYKNRTWGGGAFVVDSMCPSNGLNYQVVRHGEEDHAIVDVEGWGNFSVDLDVVAHDYAAKVKHCDDLGCWWEEEEESGLELDLGVDAVLNEGSVVVDLGPLLGKQRDDGTYKTDVLLDVSELQNLSIVYDGQSGTDWEGNDFAIDAAINSVKLAWRITPTGSLDLEIYHDTVKGGGRSYLAAFVEPSQQNSLDYVDFQATGTFDLICSSWNFILWWSGDREYRCSKRFTFITIGESS